MLNVKILDEGLEPIWDDLVARLEGGTVFHTWAWMRVIEKQKRVEKLPFGIFDGSELVGILPMFRMRRGPLTILASPLGGDGYGGPLVDRCYHQAVVEQLGALAKRFHADYVELRSWDQRTAIPLAAQGYAVENLQTYVLDLARDRQEIWNKLEGNCRTAIRKAQRNGVEIVEAVDRSFLDAYYEIVRDTWSKSNRQPPLTKQDYATVWDILRPQGRVKVLLAQHDGRLVAGRICLCFRDRLYGWESAALRSALPLRPNNLLMWAFIEWGVSNGLTQYDMLGANIPRIARFKQSFGGELRTYVYAYGYVTWQARIGTRLYRWLIPRMRRASYKLQHAAS
jgi:CelD/BcsL family acetyltransferase involved in cellulose biosynthesis